MANFIFLRKNFPIKLIKTFIISFLFNKYGYICSVYIRQVVCRLYILYCLT